MAKTTVSRAAYVDGKTFAANARPDPVDLRDLTYRPMLRPLPPVLDARPDGHAFEVLEQVGESCTGHAIAAVINTVLARQAAELNLNPPGVVSPYMLYRLARRYDEYRGEGDLGSSLRGVFKGWLRHGLALDEEWNAIAAQTGMSPIDAPIDIDNPAFLASCQRRPLGAYYRVDPYRLDDMQSAIAELHAIAVSAVIHRGWEHPAWVTGPDGHGSMIIKRDVPADLIGGHAFCIVGYNELGFLVQNSWGTSWGKGGFATLLYDDWLASAHDAWVCRPGVPNTPFAAPSVTSRATTAGDAVLNGGPNLTLLRNYVVNTGNDGWLSSTGKFVSTPGQLDEMFANMSAKHAAWSALDGTSDRHVLLYAHGGLIDEHNGLSIAQHQLGWWLNSHVYPISFCWESGAFETMTDALEDAVRRILPFGRAGFDLTEQADRAVEIIARTLCSGLWQQMKDNATLASGEDAPPTLRGGTEIGRRLLTYIADHPDAHVRIHLAGHSAGSIFLCALVERLTAMGLTIDSVAFMGGAATNAQVERQLLPAFVARPAGPDSRGFVRRFTAFNLSEQREEDDACPYPDRAFYHKSLLYLVARGLEPHPDPATQIVPCVGLEVGLDMQLPSGTGTLREAIESTEDDCDGMVVIAPTASTAEIRSEARGHGDFDNDPTTMTSVLRRMLNGAPLLAGSYHADMPVADLPASAPVTVGPAAVGAIASPAIGPAGAERPRNGLPRDGVPPDGTPREETPRDEVASTTGIDAVRQFVIPTEAAIAARSGSPAFDMLGANGYRWDAAAGEPPKLEE